MAFNYTDVRQRSREAAERGDVEEMRRLRSEVFNHEAQEARKRGDDLMLYLMSCVEEAEKRGLHHTKFVFQSLLTFYSFRPETLEALAENLAPAFLQTMLIAKSAIDDKERSARLQEMLGEEETAR